MSNSDKFLGTKIFFSKKIEHPKFIGRKVDHDVGLLILQDDITDLCIYHPKLIPVSLPRELKEYSSGSAIIVGWGDVEESKMDNGAFLRAAYVDFVDPKWWSLDSQLIDDSVIITHKEKTSTMPGDSGGPLIYVNDDGKKIQIGIISARNIESTEFNFFMSTAYFIDFIKENSVGDVNFI
ncbi:trypsin-2-like [Centruroides vittatus]|uniref:trypsin-2-like n=1 Tax=Centruroides vittatus TaxID=120091 RepID=UPI00351097E7